MIAVRTNLCFSLASNLMFSRKNQENNEFYHISEPVSVRRSVFLNGQLHICFLCSGADGDRLLGWCGETEALEGDGVGGHR